MAVGVLQSNRPQEVVAEVPVETEPVLIARKDIERGTMVTEDQVEVREWPEGFAPEGALTSVACAVERVAIGNLMAGELILDGKLASPEAGRGLSALIPPGKRAFTVHASKVASSVAGFVLPGNNVDVLLNMRGGRGDDTGGGSTITMLQAVEVLAVDQRLEAPSDNRVDPNALRSVTLLVTPEQANQLDLGQNMGQLALALRNPSDRLIQSIDEATVAGIRFQGMGSLPYLDGDLPPPPMFAAQQEPASAPAVPRQETGAAILTLRGSQRGQIQLVAGSE